MNFQGQRNSLCLACIEHVQNGAQQGVQPPVLLLPFSFLALSLSFLLLLSLCLLSL
jgi:hypothetical protein